MQSGDRKIIPYKHLKEIEDAAIKAKLRAGGDDKETQKLWLLYAEQARCGGELIKIEEKIRLIPEGKIKGSLDEPIHQGDEFRRRLSDINFSLVQCILQIKHPHFLYPVRDNLLSAFFPTQAQLDYVKLLFKKNMIDNHTRLFNWDKKMAEKAGFCLPLLTYLDEIKLLTDDFIGQIFKINFDKSVDLAEIKGILDIFSKEDHFDNKSAENIISYFGSAYYSTYYNPNKAIYKQVSEAVSYINLSGLKPEDRKKYILKLANNLDLAHGLNVFFKIYNDEKNSQIKKNTTVSDGLELIYTKNLSSNDCYRNISGNLLSTLVFLSDKGKLDIQLFKNVLKVNGKLFYDDIINILNSLIDNEIDLNSFFILFHRKLKYTKTAILTCIENTIKILQEEKCLNQRTVDLVLTLLGKGYCGLDVEVLAKNLAKLLDFLKRNDLYENGFLDDIFGNIEKMGKNPFLLSAGLMKLQSASLLQYASLVVSKFDGADSVAEILISLQKNNLLVGTENVDKLSKITTGFKEIQEAILGYTEKNNNVLPQEMFELFLLHPEQAVNLVKIINGIQELKLNDKTKDNYIERIKNIFKTSGFSSSYLQACEILVRYDEFNEISADTLFSNTDYDTYETGFAYARLIKVIENTISVENLKAVFQALIIMLKQLKSGEANKLWNVCTFLSEKKLLTFYNWKLIYDNYTMIDDFAGLNLILTKLSPSLPDLIMQANFEKAIKHANYAYEIGSALGFFHFVPQIIFDKVVEADALAMVVAVELGGDNFSSEGGKEFLELGGKEFFVSELIVEDNSNQSDMNQTLRALFKDMGDVVPKVSGYIVGGKIKPSAKAVIKEEVNQKRLLKLCVQSMPSWNKNNSNLIHKLYAYNLLTVKLVNEISEDQTILALFVTLFENGLITNTKEFKECVNHMIEISESLTDYGTIKFRIFCNNLISRKLFTTNNFDLVFKKYKNKQITDFSELNIIFLCMHNSFIKLTQAIFEKIINSDYLYEISEALLFAGKEFNHKFKKELFDQVIYAGPKAMLSVVKPGDVYIDGRRGKEFFDIKAACTAFIETNLETPEKILNDMSTYVSAISDKCHLDITKDSVKEILIEEILRKHYQEVIKQLKISKNPDVSEYIEPNPTIINTTEATMQDRPINSDDNSDEITKKILKYFEASKLSKKENLEQLTQLINFLDDPEKIQLEIFFSTLKTKKLLTQDNWNLIFEKYENKTLANIADINYIIFNHEMNKKVLSLERNFKLIMDSDEYAYEIGQALSFFTTEEKSHDPFFYEDQYFRYIIQQQFSDVVSAGADAMLVAYQNGGDNFSSEIGIEFQEIKDACDQFIISIHTNSKNLQNEVNKIPDLVSAFAPQLKKIQPSIKKAIIEGLIREFSLDIVFHNEINSEIEISDRVNITTNSEPIASSSNQDSKRGVTNMNARIVNLDIVLSYDTFITIETYLIEIRKNRSLMGKRLAYVLADTKDLEALTIEQFIDALLKTTKPCIFAERIDQLQADGSDWWPLEISLLERIARVVNDMLFYSPKSKKVIQADIYPQGEEVHALAGYVSGAMLAGNGNQRDLKHVLNHAGKFDADKYYELLEENLLPMLKYINTLPKTGKKVVTLPILGGDLFAGKYAKEIKKCFPEQLKRLIKNHIRGRTLNDIDEFVLTGASCEEDEIYPLGEELSRSFNVELNPTRLTITADYVGLDPKSKLKPDPENKPIQLIVLIADDPLSHYGNEGIQGLDASHEAALCTLSNSNYKLTSVEGKLNNRRIFSPLELANYEEVCARDKVTLNYGVAYIPGTNNLTFEASENYKPRYLEAKKDSNYLAKEEKAANDAAKALLRKDEIISKMKTTIIKLSQLLTYIVEDSEKKVDPNRNKSMPVMTKLHDSFGHRSVGMLENRLQIGEIYLRNIRENKVKNEDYAKYELFCTQAASDVIQPFDNDIETLEEKWKNVGTKKVLLNKTPNELKLTFLINIKKNIENKTTISEAIENRYSVEVKRAGEHEYLRFEPGKDDINVIRKQINSGSESSPPECLIYFTKTMVFLEKYGIATSFNAPTWDHLVFDAILFNAEKSICDELADNTPKQYFREVFAEDLLNKKMALVEGPENPDYGYAFNKHFICALDEKIQEYEIKVEEEKRPAKEVAPVPQAKPEAKTATSNTITTKKTKTLSREDLKPLNPVTAIISPVITDTNLGSTTTTTNTITKVKEIKSKKTKRLPVTPIVANQNNPEKLIEKKSQDNTIQTKVVASQPALNTNQPLIIRDPANKIESPKTFSNRMFPPQQKVRDYIPFCRNTIHAYHSDKSFVSHTRYGRANHLENLIEQSVDKNKLIVQLYMHYLSISDSKSGLLKCIEKCLINLLEIKGYDSTMSTDSADALILKAMTEKKRTSPEFSLTLVKDYEQKLEKLKELDARETAWFGGSPVNEKEFDNVMIGISRVNYPRK